MASKRKYYAVAVGVRPGIYDTWDECERQVRGFKGQKYKSFHSRAEAEDYVRTVRSQCGMSGSAFPANTSRGATMPFQSRNPFREHAHQSASVLDMAPADYESRVQPDAVSLTGGATSFPAPSRATPPAHLSANMDGALNRDLIYQIEYDGASKGNPGVAGAGALLRHPDGSVVREVSVGLGRTTNNVAEYRGLIAGLRAALDLGIYRVQVQGDSKLVTMQVRRKWKINEPHLKILCNEAVALVNNFKEFQIRHVDREYNSAADVLANKGIFLPEERFVSSFPPMM